MLSRTVVAVFAALVLALTAPGASASPSSPGVGQPNLWLLGFAYGYNCTSFGSVNATVQNTGSVPSPRFLVSVHLDDVFIGTLAWPRRVQAGETVTVGPTGWHSQQFEPGESHTVTWLVDPRDQIAESDEGDNGAIAEFAC